MFSLTAGELIDRGSVHRGFNTEAINRQPMAVTSSEALFDSS